MTVEFTANGTIVYLGDTSCDQRGFEWGYSTGSYPNSWTESGTFIAEAFSHQFTGLLESHTVFYRAKAHNTQGWAYGSEVSFATPSSVTNKFVTSMIRSVSMGVGGLKLSREGMITNIRSGRPLPRTATQVKVTKE